MGGTANEGQATAQRKTDRAAPPGLNKCPPRPQARLHQAGPSVGCKKSPSFRPTGHTGMLISGTVHDPCIAALAQLEGKTDDP